MVLGVGATAATAKDDNGRELQASLDGYQETPTLSTPGHGRFRARINADSIEYTLSYADLDGGDSAKVTQAHIHLGRPAIAGGISAWLCQTATNPSPNPATPTCPDRAGTVSGTIRAADVVGPTGQGIAAGEFDELVRALRASATYANVHTVLRPAGEIRGRIRSGD
jgi:hypothetical protein